MSKPPAAPSGDARLSVHGQRRRSSRSDGRSRSPSPLPHPSISSSPTPPLQPHASSAPSSSSSSPPLSIPTSLLTAGATVQQTAGAWWKKANAFYQQATAPSSHASPTDLPPTHARRNSDQSRAPDVALPSVSSSPTPPRSGQNSPELTPSPSAPPSSGHASSFFSSVLSSVSAAVSSVSLPSASSLSSASFSVPSFPSSNPFSDDASTEGQPSGGADVAPEFVELDIGHRAPQFPEALLPPQPPSTASPSPFSLALFRMSLLSAVLSDDVGGHLSSVLFFPRSCWFAPSLRLPAVMQKVQALEAFHAQLVEVVRLSKQADAETGLRPSLHWTVDGLDALLVSCRRMQNELAFSLTAIKESSTPAAAPSRPDGDADRPVAVETASTTAALDGIAEGDAAATAPSEAAAGAVQGSTTGGAQPASGTAAATVDRFSNRVKAIGYSIAKSAHRIGKAVLADKMSREQAELYIVFVQRIAAQLVSIQPAYQRAREELSRKAGALEQDAGSAATASAEEAEDGALVARLDAVGVFVCEVLVVFIVDDVQRALLRHLTEQQEALMRGVATHRRRSASAGERRLSSSRRPSIPLTKTVDAPHDTADAPVNALPTQDAHPDLSS